MSSAELIVPCSDLSATLDYFTKSFGFSVTSIFPADNPREAVLIGHGLTMRLIVDATGGTPDIRIRVADVTQFSDVGLVAPNGTRVEIAPLTDPMVVPEGTIETVLSGASSDFGHGRAGMGYRDLIPGRHGGRFIASHIRVGTPGPVPDYVHYHEVMFQFLYVRRGWARVLYEDQGEANFFGTGDCILQPPEIRHRVMESDGPLEVIELGCPADHITIGEQTMKLPNGPARPGQSYGGQKFVHHIKAEGVLSKWHQDGFVSRDTGISAATNGLVGVKVLTPTGDRPGDQIQNVGEFQFFFALDGGVSIVTGGSSVRLESGESVSLAAGTSFALDSASRDLDLLSASVPS